MATGCRVPPACSPTEAGGPLLRFIRLNPRHNSSETLTLLSDEIQNWYQAHHQSPSQQPQLGQPFLVNWYRPVPWLDVTENHTKISMGFYAIPGTFPLDKSNLFRLGRIYGMDVSSGAAVVSLLSSQFDQDYNTATDMTSSNNNRHSTMGHHEIKSNCGDATSPEKSNIASFPPHDSDKDEFSSKNDKLDCFRVLDLCCAPGLKLCAMADWIDQYHNNHYEHHYEHHHEDNVPSNQPPSSQNNDDKTTTTSILQRPPSSRLATLVGVDISKARLDVCQRIVTKYWVHPETSGVGHHPHHHQNHRSDCTEDGGNKIRIQLYCHDGTTFGTLPSTSNNNDNDKSPPRQHLLFDSVVEAEEYKSTHDNNNNNNIPMRKRKNKSARARQRKRLKEFHAEESMQPPSTCGTDTETHVLMVHQFDRVLVDAECSTDGSIKHILKRDDKTRKQRTKEMEGCEQIQSEQACNSFTGPKALVQLVQLQMKLIESGFRLLKNGGFMVYSTCSLSQDQNENIVSWLLSKYPAEAYLVPLRFPVAQDHHHLNPVDTDKKEHPTADTDCDFIFEGSLPGTVRFQPNFQTVQAYPVECIPSNFPRANLFGGGFFLAKIGKRKTGLQ